MILFVTYKTTLPIFLYATLTKIIRYCSNIFTFKVTGNSLRVNFGFAYFSDLLIIACLPINHESFKSYRCHFIDFNLL